MARHIFLALENHAVCVISQSYEKKSGPRILETGKKSRIMRRTCENLSRFGESGEFSAEMKLLEEL